MELCVHGVVNLIRRHPTHSVSARIHCHCHYESRRTLNLEWAKIIKYSHESNLTKM